MRLLIAVVTCRTRQDWADAVRQSWACLVPPGVDVQFFVGRGSDPCPDAVCLDCSDSYSGLPDKVREIVRWALERDYDYMLKCDDDVVLDVPHVLDSGYDKFDFTGNGAGGAGSFPIPFGFCYWLSRRAMTLVAPVDLPRDNNDEAWVTGILANNGIQLNHDGRYYLDYGRDMDPSPPRRSLRKPPEHAHAWRPNIFAWCMHNKVVPRERSILEFKRIFRDSCTNL